MARSTTKTDSPVAAREQLNERASEDHSEDRLEETAQQQEQTQKDELKAGANAPKGVHQQAIDQDNVAAARRSAGFSGSGVQNGFVDQISRRSQADALEGHFVTIDKSADGVEDAYKAVQGLTDEDGNVLPGNDYGVMMEPGDLDPETGYPVTASVRLRGDTPALVSVPYEALTPADAGRR